MGAVSAWRAHNLVSLLHFSCECDDLWSLRKGSKHAETGCGSTNTPPPPPSTTTHTQQTHITHTCTFTHALIRAFIKSQIVMAVGRGRGKVNLPGQLTHSHAHWPAVKATHSFVAHQTNSVILMVASSRGHA